MESKYTVDDLVAAGFTKDQIEVLTGVKGTQGIINPEKSISPSLDEETGSNKSVFTMPVRKTAAASLNKVTTIDDLKEYAKGQVVELPAFGDGQPLVVRMKRPSLMVLAKSGKIPNKLLKTATELFNGTDNDVDDFDALSKTFELLEIICEASLVEPKYHDFKTAGIELSDEQLIAIFNYTQRGIEALNSFH